MALHGKIYSGVRERGSRGVLPPKMYLMADDRPKMGASLKHLEQLIGKMTGKLPGEKMNHRGTETRRTTTKETHESHNSRTQIRTRKL